MKESTREKILDFIISNNGSFDFANNRDEGIIPFLNEIWNLKEMPSEDHRFSNAEGDIIQHTINNDDWDLYELFKNRLKILKDVEKFIKFIEIFLHPKYQGNSKHTYYLIDKISDLLKSDNLTLATISYDGDYPIIEVSKLQTLDRPSDVPKNNIPFFVVPYPNLNLNRYISRLEVDNDKPKKYFLLIADNWNDNFRFHTSFMLVFFDNGTKKSLGALKIATNKSNDTSVVIPEQFYYLEEGYVSLGQEKKYYNNLANVFGKNILSVLYALKDSAFFTEISEEFENKDIFKFSLIREDDAERLHRVARPMVDGADMDNLYSFTYDFLPKYAKASVDIPFLFSTDNVIPKRMITLIGRNGVGKTQLLTTLPLEIAQENNSRFQPQKPVYSKIIAVSYSTFDNFELPKKTSNFNYIYCGLRDENGDLRSKQGQLQKFHHTWKRITNLGRLEKWKKIISNFLEEELIDLFIKIDPENKEKLFFDLVGFREARESLSSGQSIVLYVVSEIVANIRLDSFLLFDEPETHLHPNAISQLMNGISDLIEEFESYCVIATHSPIIIQEMFARDVLVLTRSEKLLSVSNIGVESFGENLSIITEEVFGNRAIPKSYEATIKKLVRRYRTYDRVIEIMKEDSLPLSLNVRLYLQSLVESNVKN
jgi:ABC-type branched-subunit amino acid transport system ATPase component